MHAGAQMHQNWIEIKSKSGLRPLQGLLHKLHEWLEMAPGLSDFDWPTLCWCLKPLVNIGRLCGHYEWSDSPTDNIWKYCSEVICITDFLVGKYTKTEKGYILQEGGTEELVGLAATSYWLLATGFPIGSSWKIHHVSVSQSSLVLSPPSVVQIPASLCNN